MGKVVGQASWWPWHEIIQQIPAELFMGMLSEPLSHLVVGPIPLKGACVPLVVFRTGDSQVLDQFAIPAATANP